MRVRRLEELEGVVVGLEPRGRGAAFPHLACYPESEWPVVFKGLACEFGVQLRRGRSWVEWPGNIGNKDQVRQELLAYTFLGDELEDRWGEWLWAISEVLSGDVIEAPMSPYSRDVPLGKVLKRELDALLRVQKGLNCYYLVDPKGNFVRGLSEEEVEAKKLNRLDKEEKQP